MITFSWTQAAFNGGRSVIDYRIIYDQAEGLYVNLDVTTLTQYTTQIELSPGSTYSFTVQARSSVGYSEQSIPISILAAQIADVPDPPSTAINAATIIISWTAPYNGATPITAYSIKIRH